MTQPVTAEQLETVLAALPPTADEVAALFEELGIKGQKAVAGCCPVANYIAEEFGITTSREGAIFGPGVTFFRVAHVRGDDGEFAHMDAPEHLVGFARRFDDGEFPALVEDGSVA